MKWFFLLAAFLVGSAASAGTYTLVLTVPSTNAYVQGDSVYECSGGGPTFDLAWIRFLRQDVTGGMPYVFDSTDVHHMEGQQIEKIVDSGPGAHFYTQPVDTAGGAGCFDAGIYLPGYVTGVGIGDGPEWRQPVSVRTYDVQGRIVHGYMASGVYRRVEIFADGRRRYTQIKVIH